MRFCLKQIKPLPDLFSNNPDTKDCIHVECNFLDFQSPNFGFQLIVEKRLDQFQCDCKNVEVPLSFCIGHRSRIKSHVVLCHAILRWMVPDSNACRNCVVEFRSTFQKYHHDSRIVVSDGCQLQAIHLNCLAKSRWD